MANLKHILSLILFLIHFFWSQNSYSKLNYNEVSNCLLGFTNYEDEIRANEVVVEILEKLGLKNNFFITKTCYGLNNAIATKFLGTNYILLDLEWAKEMKADKNDWFELYVISHEIGHHVLGHVEKIGKTNLERRQFELDSDYFAGIVLGKFGANENIPTDFFKFLPDSEFPELSTHPENKKRISEVKRGILESQKDEKIKLIENLTRDSGFNLENFELIVSEARILFSRILHSGDITLVDKAVEKYQQALRFEDDHNLTYELGYLFLIKKDYKKFLNSLYLSYQLTGDKMYLYEITPNIFQIGNANLLKNEIVDINIKLRNDDISSYNMNPKLINLLNHHLVNWEISEQKSKHQLVGLEKLATKLIEDTRANRTKYEYVDLATIYNTRGLIRLRLELFLESSMDFQEAHSYNILSLKNQRNDDKLFKISERNSISILHNLMLVNVRLRNWEQVLQYSKEFEVDILKYSNLFQIDFRYKKWISDKHYFLGRSYHGLKDFNKAIDNYSKSLSLSSPTNFYLYYYRGLSKMGIGNEASACEDFKIACENNINDSCSRLNLICI